MFDFRVPAKTPALTVRSSYCVINTDTGVERSGQRLAFLRLTRLSLTINCQCARVFFNKLWILSANWYNKFIVIYVIKKSIIVVLYKRLSCCDGTKLFVMRRGQSGSGCGARSHFRPGSVSHPKRLHFATLPPTTAPCHTTHYCSFCFVPLIMVEI